MRLIKSVMEIQELSLEFRCQGSTIGFVPTMGALHSGHRSLIKAAVENNDETVVSIFINPLQFNNVEDLSAYPRDVETDIAYLRSSGCTVVYVPEVEEMYPATPIVSVDFGHLNTQLEGQFRPGHFRGVGIIMAKLLNQVRPHRVYMGLKDLQQFLLISRMVEDLSFDTEVIGMPTVRESSGLALSSRNVRLTSKGKVIAANLYKGLLKAADLLRAHTPPARIKDEIIEFYARIEGLDIEYLEIVDAGLSSVDSISNGTALAVCVAAYVEGVRLIDNVYLQQD